MSADREAAIREARFNEWVRRLEGRYDEAGWSEAFAYAAGACEHLEAELAAARKAADDDIALRDSQIAALQQQIRDEIPWTEDGAYEALRERNEKLWEALRGVSNAYGCFAGCTGELPGAPPDAHTPACRKARAALSEQP